MDLDQHEGPHPEAPAAMPSPPSSRVTLSPSEQTELEETRNMLQQIDSILESDIFNYLKRFIQLGGTPHQVINYLSESYRGYPEMCRLLVHWLSLTGMKDEEILDIVEDHIRDSIVSKFDASKVDKIFESDLRPSWLIEMIRKSKWRHLLYQLSESNRDCLFLNFGIQKISLTGYDDEIASLPSAATYFNVYNRLMLNTIRKALAAETESELGTSLSNFSKLCDHAEHIFLYTHAILHSLFGQPNGHKLKRIAQQLDQCKKARESGDVDHEGESSGAHSEIAQITQSIKFHLLNIHAYPAVHASIQSILFSSTPSSADVRNLYLAYSQKPLHTTEDYAGTCTQQQQQQPPPRSNHHEQLPPPSVEYLRNHDLLHKLIAELFDPSKQISSDFVYYYCWVVAYASCSDDTRSVMHPTTEDPASNRSYSSDTVDAVTSSLKVVQAICQRNYFGFELAGSPSDQILEFLPYPIISIGVLYWIRVNISDPDRLATSWNTKSLSTQLAIWREIVATHPLQCFEAFQVLIAGFETDPSLGPLDALNLKKMMMETLVYLPECGYVMPVISQVEVWSRTIDPSLTRHFLICLLDLISPPYSRAFLNPVIQLISRIRIQSAEQSDVFVSFAEHVLGNASYSVSQESVKILQDLKTVL